MPEQIVKIQPIEGEPMRFHSPSISQPTMPHLIDLMAYDGNGECSCWSFRGEKRSNMLAGKPTHTPLTRCKHIRAAITFMGEKLVEDYGRIVAGGQA